MIGQLYVQLVVFNLECVAFYWAFAGLDSKSTLLVSVSLKPCRELVEQIYAARHLTVRGVRLLSEMQLKLIRSVRVYGISVFAGSQLFAV